MKVLSILFALLVVGSGAFVTPNAGKSVAGVKALQSANYDYERSVRHNRPYNQNVYGNGVQGSGFGYNNRNYNGNDRMNYGESVSRRSNSLDTDRRHGRGYNNDNYRNYDRMSNYDGYDRGYNNRNYNSNNYQGYNNNNNSMDRRYNNGGYNNRYSNNREYDNGYGRGYNRNYNNGGNMRLEVDGLPSFHELYEHQDYERQARRYSNSDNSDRRNGYGQGNSYEQGNSYGQGNSRRY